jgi:urease accessory protein
MNTVQEKTDSESPSVFGLHRAWHAKINLEYASQPHKTVLEDMSFSGPLRVQRPFYPEGACCHTYLLHPPGGMVSGDKIDIAIKAKRNSHALITTPSAGKIYGTDSLDIAQHQVVNIEAEPNSIVEWLPQENILFNRAKARLATKIELAKGAKLIAWDMLSFGRPAGGYWFETGSLQQQFSLYYNNEPMAIENFSTDPALQVLKSNVGLMGYLNMGAFYIIGDTPETALEIIRETIAPHSHGKVGQDLLVAASQKSELVVVRALARNAEQLRLMFFEIWQKVRRNSLGNDACMPRIWLT